MVSSLHFISYHIPTHWCGTCGPFFLCFCLSTLCFAFLTSTLNGINLYILCLVLFYFIQNYAKSCLHQVRSSLHNSFFLRAHAFARPQKCFKCLCWLKNFSRKTNESEDLKARRHWRKLNMLHHWNVNFVLSLTMKMIYEVKWALFWSRQTE